MAKTLQSSIAFDQGKLPYAIESHWNSHQKKTKIKKRQMAKTLRSSVAFDQGKLAYAVESHWNGHQKKMKTERRQMAKTLQSSIAFDQGKLPYAIESHWNGQQKKMKIKKRQMAKTLRSSVAFDQGKLPYAIESHWNNSGGKGFERNGKDPKKTGTDVADPVAPVQIDGSVRFDGVGGLSDHISALKEMVIFPLLYPEFFERFKLRPPRGCLFYGPPGTGKTLVARALANECSQGDRRISFFMRKGADCLSEWVGESERQLRLLFEQAYKMRPSIIFFDEIDGLAPVRSSRQDQIHSSLVTTLLALMDGLESRGEIVVIGATNRLDSLDPALRRPGRFDREFLFALPNKEARKEILKIHMRAWSPKPLDAFLEELAEKCVGYCGADIQSLCAEAALCALRRHYPRIYTSRQKLQIDIAAIEVAARDFAEALRKIAPASQRAVASPAQPLSAVCKPLLQRTLERLLKALQRVFPQAALALKKDQQPDGANPILGNGCMYSHEASPSGFAEELFHQTASPQKETFLHLNRDAYCQPTCYRPRFLIAGEPGCGQSSHLAPAVIHALEEFAAYTLDLPALFVSSTSPEERCAQLIREAQRTAPSILYVPRIHVWWEAAGVTLRATFTTLLENIPAYAPVLLLATSDVRHAELAQEVRDLFSEAYGEVFHVQLPDEEEGRKFFEDLLLNQAAQPAASKRKAACQEHGVQPAASPPEPRLPAEEQMKQFEEQAEETLPAGPLPSHTPFPSAVSSRKRRSNASPSVSLAEKRRRFPSSEENETHVCLRQLLSAAAGITKKFSIFHREKLHVMLSQCIFRHRQDDDKTQLIEVVFLTALPIAVTPLLHGYSVGIVSSSQSSSLYRIVVREMKKEIGTFLGAN
ncbi:ATPase family AAA domain-containing protein 2-like [Rhea pennata]|uniref:ATPase family AAA domain-containing protein 2-like n=1 Tax=Rhea pennata TaxID=8795 RepID=UPI002E265C24